MRSLGILALLIALGMGGSVLQQQASAQNVSVNFQLFYDELSPHGRWVDYPNHGYVWMPNGNPGFSPYATDGHWVFTNDGWTWVSDYPWGWATFHYGRWDHDKVHGWFWVPGNEWGPAWVSWRRSPGYYGWAPLRPGVSTGTASGKGYHEQNEQWIFVKDKDIARSDVSHHYINRNENVTIIKNSTVVVNTRKDSKSNVTYVMGPERGDVEKITHTTVKTVAVRENNKPGNQLSNDELKVYKPQVQEKGGNGKSPVPAKVVKLSDMKPVSEGKSEPKKNQDGQDKKKQGDKKEPGQ